MDSGQRASELPILIGDLAGFRSTVAPPCSAVRTRSAAAPFDCGDGAMDPFIGRGQEPHQRHYQQRGIIVVYPFTYSTASDAPFTCSLRDVSTAKPRVTHWLTADGHSKVLGTSPTRPGDDQPTTTTCGPTGLPFELRILVADWSISSRSRYPHTAQDCRRASLISVPTPGT